MKRLTVSLIVLLVGACLAVSAAADSKNPLTGNWKCVGKIPDRPDGEFQLDMEQSGEEVKGNGSNAQGSAPLKGTFKDGKFKVTISAGDISYEFEGELAGDKIKGKFAVPAASVAGTFEGTREGAAAPAASAAKATAATMTGSWTVTLKIADRPDAEGQLDLDQTGEDLKGTGSNASGSAPVKGTVKDGKFKLIVETGQANWEFEGKLDGDKISGEFAVPAAGAKGTFAGTRKKT